MGGGEKGKDLFKNQNQLRDMISQVVSSQLQLHNIRKDNNKGEEYPDDFEDDKQSVKSETLN